MSKLIQKYNVPGPRYTSYPTVPYWDKGELKHDAWLESVKKSFAESAEISLYIHLPFCESLCTFCACFKHISKNHDLEEPYIDYLLKEWQLYQNHFEQPPIIKEIHLGGGTPTFFSPANLNKLITGLLKDTIAAPEFEFSFEGHPNNTTKEHLQTLYDLGFRRVSYGVQDYNEKVQIAINRIQPFENVAFVTKTSREIGFSSVNHDLVYGLPFQNADDMRYTVERTLELMPDRIALYSYAHVPWIKGNGQRKFSEKDLPHDEEKRQLYELSKEMLNKAGYLEIGMDHFALAEDSLSKALNNKTIHRNFMGYSSSKTQLMIGLGMSAISDSWYGFAQNEKSLADYYKRIDNDELAVFRGHLLNKTDLIVRKHILNLMCTLETSWADEQLELKEMPIILARLTEMQNDGLLKIEAKKLTVTEAGRVFIRNICMAFDLKLHESKPATRIFSMTI